MAFCTSNKNCKGLDCSLFSHSEHLSTCIEYVRVVGFETFEIPHQGFLRF